MSRLELLDFQQDAVESLVDAAVTYYSSTPDRISGRVVPFVGQLRAVTGAGKTPILATAISRLAPAIILWTTKFGSVVDQTFSNLTTGGKYHHLLGADVEVIKFNEIPSYAAWQRILEKKKSGLTILVSTVAAWNSAEKDERLNVHGRHTDWGDKSRWEQLKVDRQRPLWVVYDEAHNTTSEQVELLDDLDPSGFFIASASPIKGRLNYYLTLLSQEQRDKRIIAVSTRAVVDAQLLKSTLSVADYDSEAAQMIKDVASRRATLEKALRRSRSNVTPKAIYVVESSNVESGVSRPIAIWNTLTVDCKIPPNQIAVCTNTKVLPANAISVKNIANLSDEFTHIIFNKKLQEGWDDPAVYVCYFDGQTNSATRIQQVVGRAMRQPESRHFDDASLNTAYFFINCPNDAIESIIDQLKEELRIYGAGTEPDDFEPFQIKEERKSVPSVPVRPQARKLRVPKLQLELASGDGLKRLLIAKTYDFGTKDCVAPGKALVSIVSVKTGTVRTQTRDLLEDMRVPCGRYLQEQIRSSSRNCLNSMEPSLFSNQRLDTMACYKSKALEHYKELAREFVTSYENHVQLGVLADPDDRYFEIGPYQPSGTVFKNFQHSAHARYDASSLSPDELEMAKALDKFKYVWTRNRPRLDYGIPLPLKSASSSVFYPDFLWFVGATVWALDPTGKHLLNEKIRTKLLTVPDPLKIALITRGKFDSHFHKVGDEGWTLSRFRLGNPAPESFDSLQEMLEALASGGNRAGKRAKKSKRATKQ